MLLAASRWRPGTLLDTLKGTGWPTPPPRQKVIHSQMSVLWRLRNPELEGFISL
jgi:hypothetical protein